LGKGTVVVAGDVARLRKRFFFEKKNQKTFTHGGQRGCLLVEPIAGRNLQKFFASFFQKRRSSFCPFCFTKSVLSVNTGVTR
jgi:hypothetical protein